MYWYRGWYGSWREPNGVRRIDGTYDRKKMFAEAQRIANELGVIVTVEASRGTLDEKLYAVHPQVDPLT